MAKKTTEKKKAKKKLSKAQEREVQKQALILVIAKAIEWYGSLSMEDQLLVIARHYARIHEVQIEGLDLDETTIELVGAQKEISTMFGHNKDCDETLDYIG